jgi:hypothetical protein
MKLGQNACLGNCSDEFDGSGERSRAIMALLLNLSFDVISVICRLHNLRFPFKIPFYLVPPIVFSFRAFFLFGIFLVGWFQYSLLEYC